MGEEESSGHRAKASSRSPPCTQLIATMWTQLQMTNEGFHRNCLRLRRKLASQTNRSPSSTSNKIRRKPIWPKIIIIILVAKNSAKCRQQTLHDFFSRARWTRRKLRSRWRTLASRDTHRGARDRASRKLQIVAATLTANVKARQRSLQKSVDRPRKARLAPSSAAAPSQTSDRRAQAVVWRISCLSRTQQGNHRRTADSLTLSQHKLEGQKIGKQ